MKGDIKGFGRSVALDLLARGRVSDLTNAFILKVVPSCAHAVLLVSKRYLEQLMVLSKFPDGRSNYVSLKSVVRVRTDP